MGADQIAQTGGGGRLVELKISGSYGDPADPEHGGPLLANSAGTVSIGSASPAGPTGQIVKPVDILSDLDSLTVRGAILPDVTVTVDGDVGKLSIGTLSGEFSMTGGSLTGATSVTDLGGCFNIGGNVVPPAGDDLRVTTLAGTLISGGDLDGGDGLRVDDLRPQGLIEIGGSVWSTVRFSLYMCGTLHVVGGADHSAGILARPLAADRALTKSRDAHSGISRAAAPRCRSGSDRISRAAHSRTVISARLSLLCEPVESEKAANGDDGIPFRSVVIDD